MFLSSWMFGVILDEEGEQDDTKYISVKTS